MSAAAAAAPPRYTGSIASIHRLHCVDFVVGRRELQEVHVARAGDSARGEYTYAGGSISRPETAPALRRYDASQETEEPEAIRISRLLREAHTLQRRDDGFARDAADATRHHSLPRSKARDWDRRGPEVSTAAFRQRSEGRPARGHGLERRQWHEFKGPFELFEIDGSIAGRVDARYELLRVRKRCPGHTQAAQHSGDLGGRGVSGTVRVHGFKRGAHPTKIEEFLKLAQRQARRVVVVRLHTRQQIVDEFALSLGTAVGQRVQRA
mgnify:CR=1 FL=1